MEQDPRHPRQSSGTADAWQRLENEPSPLSEWERDAVAQQRLVRMRRLRKQRQRRLLLILGILGTALLLTCLMVGLLLTPRKVPAPDLAGIIPPDWIQPALLDPNGTARDGTPLETVQDLAIHYVGNPGTTAMQNRQYFNLDGVEVCSHFIVGLDGEIVQCLPLNERSAATNQRNFDTISIEVCHPDDSGRFNDKTYAALIRLCAWLCRELDLDETHLIRHYDVTGKQCPLYYVRHEDAWLQLKRDVGDHLHPAP